ncbi:V0/A0 complex, 116-kDa subunit of ATPase [Violaceomyces palustris]|uniref:V0/A0 complex, 116-kDa subunit of ATPase n=1 Tax=Violaceomyces palustris TaxID=1673888 RepID=A0ACD0NRG7_9BASI|nr:V0/A0 complex, 116-kDa subunit of ATPase [Violaceomyces palustris]
MSDEGLFRSATMSLIQLYIPSETAHATISELGELGNVQFKDLNPDVTPFQRSFASDIRRVDEMDRRIRFLYAQMDKEKVPVRSLESALPFVNFGGLDARRGPQMMDELFQKLKEHEERLGQMNGSYETLQKRLQELEEAKHVLRETAVFFDQAEGRQEQVRGSIDDANAPLLDDVESRGFNSQRGDESGYGTFDLEFVAGTIERTRMATFERILWRVLRGNLYMNYAEIEEPFDDPTREEPVSKNVFIIFAHGAELLAKIRKISESMGGTLYPIDSNADRREESLREVLSRIEDLNNVLFSTSATRRTELVKVAESLSAWADVVRKEKLIYSTMNQFMYDSRRKTLVAEGWCPTNEIGQIQLALRRAAENAGTNAPPVLQELRTHKDPPTFQRTNKYTAALQNVGDSYGIAKYKEVNPGLFNFILLPFLFAVMFGDIFHAFLMTLAASSMCLFEKKLAKIDNDIFSMFFYGRYMMLLMGLFSMFTGLMYNDVASKSMHLFHSGWQWPRAEEGTVVEAIQLARTYPIGIDPGWHGADNALVFTNSLKMKMSVILGVCHMTLGVCLNLPNFIHFGKRWKIWAEFVPQMLFLQSLFGYLVFAIIYKWSTDWYETDASGNVFRNNPPNLLNMLIYMFLKPGDVDPKEQLYPGQATVQTFLLITAFVCVPWMLIATPYIEWREHQKIKGQGYRAIGTADGPGEDEDENGEEGSGANGHHGNGGAGGHSGSDEMEEEEHEFEMGEVIIHQVIHTIEFCLNCISNTASYLRLWALSLAHAQLSEVLWSMTISGAFGMTGVVGTLATVFAFALWFVLSIVILCCMEGLSSLLHSVRLVWVEFGSKFYQAGGYAFEPLKF